MTNSAPKNAPLKRATSRPQRPGATPYRRDLEQSDIDAMLRVDHAGETAAVAIYSAQASVFEAGKNTKPIARDMRKMCAEEQEHLDAFHDLILKHKARPTALMPVWNFASKGLGMVTALMGEKAAHACTEAVENVIEQHYAQQIEQTKNKHPELNARFIQFREDELRHRDHAVAEGADQAPAYPILSAAIMTGCKLAIKLSHKI